MRKLKITLTTILLGLGCFLLSPSVQAASDPRRPEKFTQIDVPGAIFTIATDINPQGEIVGFYLDGSFNLDGFLLSKGKFTTIDFPGAVLNIATDINPQGEIVGVYDDSSGNRHGFLRSNGVFKTIDVPGAILTVASGINPGGNIVGDYFDSSGNRHAYLLSKGKFTTIDFPGGGAFGTDVEGISAHGEIVGFYEDSSGNAHGLLRSSKGKFTIHLGHFSAFYRASWRANDFMWGRLDGAIRVVDLMVDAGQTSNVDIIAGALVPLEQDADAADRRALVVEALVDVGTPDVPEDPTGLRNLVATLIAADLGTPEKKLTRVLCARAAQYEALTEELPVLLEQVEADSKLGCFTEPIQLEAGSTLQQIRQLRVSADSPKSVAERLGRDSVDEATSTLALRTLSQATLVAQATLGSLRLPLSKVTVPGRIPFLSVSGLTSRARSRRLTAGVAYAAAAAYLTTRWLGIQNGETKLEAVTSLATIVLWIAALAVLGLVAVPGWRASRTDQGIRKLGQGIWAIALLVVGGLVAGGYAWLEFGTWETLTASTGPTPPEWMLWLVLATLGPAAYFLRRLPSIGPVRAPLGRTIDRLDTGGAVTALAVFAASAALYGWSVWTLWGDAREATEAPGSGSASCSSQPPRSLASSTRSFTAGAGGWRRNDPSCLVDLQLSSVFLRPFALSSGLGLIGDLFDLEPGTLCRAPQATDDQVSGQIALLGDRHGSERLSILCDPHRRVDLLCAQKRARLRVESEEDSRHREKRWPDPLHTPWDAPRSAGGAAALSTVVPSPANVARTRPGACPGKGQGYVPCADERVPDSLQWALGRRCGNCCSCDHSQQRERNQQRDSKSPVHRLSLLSRCNCHRFIHERGSTTRCCRRCATHRACPWLRSGRG